MTPRHLCILLLAIVATGSVTGQNDEIPVENDNHYPPEAPVGGDDLIQVQEGSGDGAPDEPLTTNTTENDKPQTESTTENVPLEDGIIRLSSSDVLDTPTDKPQCPSQCACHSDEGETSSYVVDCSGKDLTEFPTPLDTRTTALYVQNNKLTEIPKEVSSLKNLQVLNADNNTIFYLAPGSISELEQLKVLKISNNNLIEYPLDLKNSFALTKLEELDLGGNAITEFTPDQFSIFTSLKTLTIPSSITEKSTVINKLCESQKASLEKVCTDKCSTDEFLCNASLHALQNLGEDPQGVSPSLIATENDSETGRDKTEIGTEERQERTEGKVAAPAEKGNDTSLSPVKDMAPSIANEGQPPPAQRNSRIVEHVPNEHTNNTEPVVKVGATTDVNTGGVDKSVIGFVVAGMVLIVAGITIKKNWGSIRRRFSSSPRPNERTAGANANGTSPEEVPLQDKNPV